MVMHLILGESNLLMAQHPNGPPLGENANQQWNESIPDNELNAEKGENAKNGDSNAINTENESSEPVFSFYPVDILLASDYSTSISLRSSPFDTDNLSLSTSDHSTDSNDSHKSMSTDSNQAICPLLQRDESNEIYYLSLGTPPNALFLRTPSWEWPERYTVLFWIRWSGVNGILTTFDSDAFSPIFVSESRLGCAGMGVAGRDTMRYKVTEDEWQCVIAEGGGSRTVFRVGDLQTVPTLKGVVSCDVTGQITHRLGNRGQGPGDVACAMVFDRALSNEEMEEMYEESKCEIKGPCWSKEEAQIVYSVLRPFLDSIDGITDIVMALLLGDFVMKYAL